MHPFFLSLFSSQPQVRRPAAEPGGARALSLVLNGGAGAACLRPPGAGPGAAVVCVPPTEGVGAHGTPGTGKLGALLLWDGMLASS